MYEKATVLIEISVMLRDLGADMMETNMAINEHVYPGLHGNYDSVISALDQNKYSREVLIEIAKLGLKHYREKVKAR